MSIGCQDYLLRVVRIAYSTQHFLHCTKYMKSIYKYIHIPQVTN